MRMASDCRQSREKLLGTAFRELYSNVHLFLLSLLVCNPGWAWGERKAP